MRAAYGGRAGTILLVVAAISGCANGVTASDERRIGHAEIVYLQPDANLAAYKSGTPLVYVTEYMLTGPTMALGGAAVAEVSDSAQRSALFDHAGEIAKLGFDDRMHAMFTAAIADAPWLKDKQVKVVRGIEDLEKYTRGSSADSVIYLKPRFLMASASREFIVDVLVEIQQVDRANTYQVMHTLGRQEFSFTHPLTLAKPGMSWEQQKDAGHQLASMDAASAVRYWFDDNAALLRADYVQDFPQIEAGIRQFLGDKTTTPGG